MLEGNRRIQTVLMTQPDLGKVEKPSRTGVTALPRFVKTRSVGKLYSTQLLRAIFHSCYHSYEGLYGFYFCGLFIRLASFLFLLASWPQFLDHGQPPPAARQSCSNLEESRTAYPSYKTAIAKCFTITAFVLYRLTPCQALQHCQSRWPES